MGKSRSHKVFSEDKKERKEKTLHRKLEEQEKEIIKLRREIEDLKASGKVPVVREKKEKPQPQKIRPPTQAELDERREKARKEKDFETSDVLRRELAECGYRVEDSGTGPLLFPTS